MREMERGGDGEEEEKEEEEEIGRVGREGGRERLDPFGEMGISVESAPRTGVRERVRGRWGDGSIR